MTKIPFTKYTIVILLVTIMLITVGCSSTNKAVSNDEKSLVILQGVDATTLDPGMHSESPTGNIERQIFDTLLNQTIDMKIEPWVAESYEMINNTTWSFQLRDDVYFHDGEQLTASDVKFSIERILDKDNSSPQISNFSAIKEITIKDDFILEIKTAEPYPLLLTRLAGLRIVPEHYVKEIGNTAFSLKPIGSGPYKLKEWVKDEQVSLVANEQYWKGKPNIKNIVFKPVPEAAARVMALQKGEADIIVNLPPHLVNNIENDDKIRVEEVDSTRFIMMTFTTENERVKDRKVREAINYAIDVNSIIKNIFNGKATVGTQPVGTFDLGYNSNIKPFGYDPEKAKSLLAEAGYPNGIKISMGSSSGRYMMDKEVAEAIKSQLAEVGIDATLTFAEWGNYVSQILSGAIKYDLWLIGWGSDTFDAGSTLNFWVNSEQDTCYYRIDEQTNNHVNSLLKTALKTVDDDSRAELYQQIIEQVHSDIGFANLYQQVDLYGVSNRINWSARPDEAIRIYSASWK